MIPYKDIDGDSGVICYEFGRDYIDVQFKNTLKVYRYSYLSAGVENVEHMKILAQRGNGLNSFIMRNVRNLYEKRHQIS
jgi:hypothetical protein